jgi:redox-sensitive bicupin YhaK (pirin superfamily)
MIRVRRSGERGHFNLGWLDTHHTFSFAEYYDPAHMGYGPLRVINEDVIAPGGGFPTHPHRDMEIITYLLDGALEHQDSMGTGSVIRPGEVQRMSAGTGVTHSEFNHSRVAPVHLLQIWILPLKAGLKPSYEQRAFPVDERRSKLRLVAAPDGRDGAVTLQQDVALYASLLEQGESVEHRLQPGRRAWLQIARGEVTIDGDGEALAAGDGAALEGRELLHIVAGEPSELLLFDLPPP